MGPGRGPHADVAGPEDPDIAIIQSRGERSVLERHERFEASRGPIGSSRDPDRGAGEVVMLGGRLEFADALQSVRGVADAAAVNIVEQLDAFIGIEFDPSGDGLGAGPEVMELALEPVGSGLRIGVGGGDQTVGVPGREQTLGGQVHPESARRPRPAPRSDHHCHRQAELSGCRLGAGSSRVAASVEDDDRLKRMAADVCIASARRQATIVASSSRAGTTTTAFRPMALPR